MATRNPFAKTMVKMQIPPHMGTCISIAGFTLDAEKDGTVEVPHEHVRTLQAHGLTVAPEPAEKKAK